MIEITYNGETYRFGFTRATAKAAEQEGFVVGEVTDKPTLMIPILIYHAATAYNKGIRRKLVEEIYDEIQDKDEFLTVLLEEYVNVAGSLFETNEQGNATWKRV
jgi:hypothetical protein